MPRVAGRRRAGIEPGQRHRVGLIVGQVSGRDLLDRELNAGQLRLPARFELTDSLEHQVVEALRAAAIQRHILRRERAAQAPAVGVAAPDPRRPAAPGSLAAAIVHSYRAYPGRRGRGGALETRSRRVPWVMALPPADRYRQPL